MISIKEYVEGKKVFLIYKNEEEYRKLIEIIRLHKYAMSNFDYVSDYPLFFRKDYNTFWYDTNIEKEDCKTFYTVQDLKEYQEKYPRECYKKLNFYHLL